MVGTLLPLTFCAQEWRCWRFLYDHAGRATNCREPVMWRGRHRDPNGKWWVVWTCDEHADGLVGLRRTRHPIETS